MTNHILLVDDDALLRRSLALSLEEAGYRASTAASAEEALADAGHDRPDLVLLDIGLPGMDGLDALQHFRSQVGVPVILLTARRREIDEILGLELGADDYITKPFDLDVLLAHVKTVLRRVKSAEAAVPKPAGPLTAAGLLIDPATHTVTMESRIVELTPLEFSLLHALASAPGRVFSVDELLSQVWGAEYIGQPQVVYVHMHSLRDKLGENPPGRGRILTVRGVGYKLDTGKSD